MTSPANTLRAATREDAIHLAKLVNIAGEGLPKFLWSQLAEPGVSPWDIGKKRALRVRGGFSFRNALVCEEAGRPVSTMIGYRLPDAPADVDYDDLPAMFVPLQELEDLVPGTWYINALATYPEHRSRGYGAELLIAAGRKAIESASKGLSVIVADTNAGARRLYERCGFAECASRPMVKDAWNHPGNRWILLDKPSGSGPSGQ